MSKAVASDHIQDLVQVTRGEFGLTDLSKDFTMINLGGKYEIWEPIGVFLKVLSILLCEVITVDMTNEWFHNYAFHMLIISIFPMKLVSLAHETSYRKLESDFGGLSK